MWVEIADCHVMPRHTTPQPQRELRRGNNGRGIRACSNPPCVPAVHSIESPCLPGSAGRLVRQAQTRRGRRRRCLGGNRLEEPNPIEPAVNVIATAELRDLVVRNVDSRSGHGLYYGGLPWVWEDPDSRKFIYGKGLWMARSGDSRALRVKMICQDC